MTRLSVIAAIMVVSLLGIPFVSPAVATSASYQSIDVVTAYNMIQSEDPNLVIVDVRSGEDYRLTHLYEAISVPYDNPNSLSDYVTEIENPILLVYCKTGHTSELACDAFIQLGFERVYNMLGGIQDWIANDLPVYTTMHHVSAEHGFSFSIQPLLKYCCGCSSDCSGNDESIDIEVTVLGENDNQKMTELVITIDEVVYEFVITATLLWMWEEVTDSVTRTAKFFVIDFTTPSSSSHSYSIFKYQVQHPNHEITLETTLPQLDGDSYNTSFTTARFKPTGDTGVISYELVEFDQSMKLSHSYEGLSRALKSLARMYSNDGIDNLASNYRSFGLELGYLSHVVKHEMAEFDKTVTSSRTMIIDDWLSCWTCLLAWDFLCSMTCTAACIAFPPFCFFESTCLIAGCPAAVTAYCYYVNWCP